MDPRLQNELREYRRRVLAGVDNADQRGQLLFHRLDQQLRDTAGMSAGIDTIGWHTGVMASHLGRMVAVAEHTLPMLVEYLAQSAEQLDNIAAMQANPRKTEGAEYFRDGSDALASGLIPEAVDLLTAAVSRSKSPLHATAWFNLGLALIRQETSQQAAGAFAKAADAFAKCARYSVDDSPVLSARAALMSSAAYLITGQPNKSAAVLRAALPKLDNCAEIHLALAVHHVAGDEHLYRALEIAPTLAADARVANAPNVDAVVADTCQHADSPVQRQRRLSHAIGTLVTAAQSGQLDHVSPLPDIPAAPAPGVRSLLFAETSLPATVAVADRLSHEVSAELRRLEVEAQRTQSRFEEEAREGEAMRLQARTEAEQWVANARAEAAHLLERASENAQAALRRRRLIGKTQVERIRRDSANEIAELQREADKWLERIGGEAKRAGRARYNVRSLEGEVTRLREQLWKLEYDGRCHATGLAMAQAANTPFDVPPRLQAYMELHATSGRLKSPDITQPLADLGRQRAQLLKAATSEPLVQAFRQFEAVRRELALAKRAEAWAQINRAEPERIQELKRSFENVYPRVMDMVMLREAIRQSDAKFLSAAEELSASALAVIAAATPRLEIAERQAAQELKIAQRPVQQEFMQAQRTVKLAKHSADETIPAAIEESERATQADIERLQQEAFDSVRRAQQEAAVLLQRAEAEAANIRDRADAATARTFKPALAAAQLATAKLDEAKEAVAVSMTHLATVTQDVSAPRPRIVPFALPGQLDLT